MDPFVDTIMSSLPSIVDLVVYGSLALSAGAFYVFSFTAILSSYYKDTSPLVPPTKALAAAWALASPMAVVMMGLVALGAYFPDIMPYEMSAAYVLTATLGVPLLLWPAAVALTANPAFRDAQMAVPPAAVAPAAENGGDKAQAEAILESSLDEQQADKLGATTAVEESKPADLLTKKEL